MILSREEEYLIITKIVEANLPNHKWGVSEEENTQNSKDHGNNHSYKDEDRERLCVAEVQIRKYIVLYFLFWIKNKITNNLSVFYIFNTCMFIIK